MTIVMECTMLLLTVIYTPAIAEDRSDLCFVSGEGGNRCATGTVNNSMHRAGISLMLLLLEVSFVLADKDVRGIRC